MARSLQFRIGESVLAYELESKVDKKALYGYARRIAEKDGRKTSRQPRSKSPNSRSSPTTIADSARPGRSSCGCRSNWWN